MIIEVFRSDGIFKVEYVEEEESFEDVIFRNVYFQGMGGGSGFKKRVKNEWIELVDLGELRYFLVIEVKKEVIMVIEGLREMRFERINLGMKKLQVI